MIFEIPGKPVSKGRPRFSNGRVYTPDATMQYEQEVAWRYKAAGGIQHEGPVDLSITAVYPTPKDMSKAKRALIATGQIRPMVKPDVDNLAKVILDGLNGQAYADDKQVCDLKVVKFYGDDPKVIVQVTEVQKNGNESVCSM